MKRKTKPKPKELIFMNNKGEIVTLRSDMTLDDMARAGIKLKLAPDRSPLNEQWYVHQPKDNDP